MKKLFFVLTICINNSLFSADCLSVSAPTITGPLALSRSPMVLSANATPVGSPSSLHSRRGSQHHIPALVLSGRNSPSAFNTTSKVTLGFTPMTPPSSTENSPRTPDAQKFAVVTPPTPKSTTTSTYFKALNTLTRDRYTTHSQELTPAESDALKTLGGLSLSAHSTLLEIAYAFSVEGREDFLVWVANNVPANEDTFRAYLSNPTSQIAVWDTLQARYNKVQGSACDLSDLAQPMYGWPYEADLTDKQVASAFEKQTNPRLIAAVLAEAKKRSAQDGIKVWSTTDGVTYFHLRP